MVSGIETASRKGCAACGEIKPLGDFHKQPSGQHGRHSYCRECFNARYRGAKRKAIATEDRRRQNLKSRYGLAPEQVAEMLAEQGGVCAICRTIPRRQVVDHDHLTGKPRGILCHACNIKLPAVEDDVFATAAAEYLRGRK